MIEVTRINRLPLVLNLDLIEHLEAAPDTIISLTNGQKLVVLESVEEVVRRVIDFRRAILSIPAYTPGTNSETATTGTHRVSQEVAEKANRQPSTASGCKQSCGAKKASPSSLGVFQQPPQS